MLPSALVLGSVQLVHAELSRRPVRSPRVLAGHGVGACDPSRQKWPSGQRRRRTCRRCTWWARRSLEGSSGPARSLQSTCPGTSWRYFPRLYEMLNSGSFMLSTTKWGWEHASVRDDELPIPNGKKHIRSMHRAYCLIVAIVDSVGVGGLK